MLCPAPHSGTVRRNHCFSVFRHEFAFSVPDRQTIQPAREHAGTFPIDFERAPVIAEHAGIVGHQRRLLAEIFTVQRRRRSQAGQRLQTVANSK